MDLEVAVAGIDFRVFVAKPSEIFDCPLCLNVLNDPRQCPNQHAFCFGCISTALIKKNSCPICKVNVTSANLTKPLMICGLINEMQSYCESKNFVVDSESCQWIGRFSDRK